MQGTSGRGYSILCLALNNAEDGSLRLALWLKIDEKKKRLSSDLNYKSGFLLIFIQDLGGIVLILETIKDSKYWIRLNTTIEHFNLPIDTWSVGSAAYSKYK
jgi:hypothetical protein